MRLPLSKNVFGGHLQTLRRIVKKWAVGPQDVVFEFEAAVSRGARIDVHLKSNAATDVAIDDFDREAVCAALCNLQKKRILFSYNETWKSVGAKEQYQFVQAAIRFFFVFQHGTSYETKQIFRLEWENWLLSDPPNRAAYPHWQFDRWLTGSDAQTIEDIRKALQDHAEEKVFDTAEAQVRSERPNLSWFTRVHFPSAAQWAASEIGSLEAASQPHRSIPESVKELENWLEWALCYIASEVEAHARYG